MKRSFAFPALALLALALAHIAGAADASASTGPTADRAAEIAQLRAQLADISQRLAALEARSQGGGANGGPQADALPTGGKPAANAPGRVNANDRGFTLASADGANSLKLRGLVQLDSRLFFNDDGNGLVNNAFVLRRARVNAEGVFAKNYSFQLVSEFGGGSAAGVATPIILDANLGITLSPSVQFKAGKMKVPVGLELLQADSWTFFNERSIATNLVPNRDLGFQLGGDLASGKLTYAVGVFGGVADAASTTNADFDNEKDFAGRVYFTPVAGLSFGVGGSIGRQKTAAGRTGGYRTDGQQTFFSYAATTIADSQSWRVAPQAEYRKGPLGFVGEYVISTANLRPSATGVKTAVQNRAWQLGAGYVLTGENSAFNGVQPTTNFDPAAGTWGAFEIVGRYSNLKVDDDAFPVLASAASSASEASAFGVGANWYLSKTVRASFDYYHTHFGFNPAAPAISTNPILRQDEQAVITRLQVAF